MAQNASTTVSSVCVLHPRRLICTGLLASIALLSACTTILQPGQPPITTLSTPNGPVPLGGPGSLGANGPGGSLAALPPGLAAGTLPTPAGEVRAGTYAGYADVLSTGGGLCLTDQAITNFKVHGNKVQFGEMSGTIATDGALQMVFGNTWIVGRFYGETFRGQIISGGPMGCTFVLELDRVGR
jgi:hypothetical protein